MSALPLVPAHALAAWKELADALSRTRPPCRAGDPNDWCGDGDAAFAAAACRTCPARIPCATYATVADERYGIWAGVDRSLPRRRRAS